MGRERDREVARFIERAGPCIRLDRAILFGSRARGDALERSDYDLILVSPDFAGRPFFARSPPLLLLWDSDLELELLCYTPEEYKAKRRGMNGVSVAVEEGVDVTAGPAVD